MSSRPQRQVVNKLGLRALLKLLFALSPIVGAVSFSWYTIVLFMETHDLRRWTFLPTALAFGLLFYIANVLVFQDIRKIEALRKRKR